MSWCHTDKVYEFLFNKLLTVVYGIKNFTNGDWGGSVLPNRPIAFLTLRGHRVFHPVHSSGLKSLP